MSILALSVIGIPAAPIFTPMIVVENGWAGALALLGMGVASVGPLWLLVWVATCERWRPTRPSNLMPGVRPGSAHFTAST